MSNEINAAQVAQLLGVSRQHFTDRISKKPDFPKPCVNFSPRSRRWRLDEVLSWRAGRSGAGAGAHPAKVMTCSGDSCSWQRDTGA